MLQAPPCSLNAAVLPLGFCPPPWTVRVKAPLSSEFRARLDYVQLTFFGVEEKPLARGLTASPTAAP